MTSSTAIASLFLARASPKRAPLRSPFPSGEGSEWLPRNKYPKKTDVQGKAFSAGEGGPQRRMFEASLPRKADAVAVDEMHHTTALMHLEISQKF